MRLDADQMLAPIHDELADGDLASLLHRFADDGIALVRLVTVGDKVVGLLPKATVDLRFVDDACSDAPRGLAHQV